MTNPVVQIVDFVHEVRDVVSQVLALFFALGGLHRLARGSGAELLNLHSGNQRNTIVFITS